MDAYSEFLRLLGAPGAGLGALTDAPRPVGLSALAVDPMGDATAVLEARRRQQVEEGRAPAWMRDIAANIGNLAEQPLSAFIPPELRDRLPSAQTLAEMVLGAAPGSGDYMAARDALESSAASMSALGRGDYMGAGARGVDALTAGLGIMPFLPYLASIKGAPRGGRAVVPGDMPALEREAAIRAQGYRPETFYRGSTVDNMRDPPKSGTGFSSEGEHFFSRDPTYSEGFARGDGGQMFSARLAPGRALNFGDDLTPTDLARLGRAIEALGGPDEVRAFLSAIPVNRPPQNLAQLDSMAAQIPDLPIWPGGTLYQFLDRRGTVAANEVLRRAGFDAIDTGRDMVMLTNQGIRSPQAAFDPAKRSSADILAGLGALAVPAAGLAILGIPEVGGEDDY